MLVFGFRSVYNKEVSIDQNITKFAKIGIFPDVDI